MKGKLALLTAIVIGAVIRPVDGQAFTIQSNQVEIAVAPGFNHTPVRLSVAPGTPAINPSNLVVSSDAAWVTPSVDAAASKIVLSFVTSNLINSVYTATITASAGGQTNTVFVKANIAPLNIFKLKDDPLRSRTYGIAQNGLGLGSVVVLDPVTTNAIGNITVGKKPSDLAESSDGRELFVINCVDETISVIDLTTLAIKETLVLPVFDNWGQDSTTANIALGPSNIIYYTDGAWAPPLRVLNRSTLQVLQTVFSQGASGDGIGDIGVTSDKSLLFGWMQYGWSAGLANSYPFRFSIDASGLLTFAESGPSQYSSVFARDPLETPVLVSSDNQTVFIKGFALGSDSAANIKRTFPSAIYSSTPGGEIAVTDSSIYKTDSGIKLADLPRVTTVQTISSDYSRLIYFDSAARSIKILNLLDLVGPGILNRDIVPADRSITLSPARLQWSPLPGVDQYRVFLGQSETAVATAGTNSPLYLGTVTQPYIVLSSALTPGTKYYWRVDAVSQFDTTQGDVNEFTVSVIASSLNQISGATVQGHADYRVSFALSSDPSGIPWSATADRSWVTFVQSTGATPATVQVILNASQLAPGLQQANVMISSGSNTLFSIPVSLRVDPLNLTILKSDPQSVLVYGISEDSSTLPARAYLLEINSLTESIRRVVSVGSSVTDLAVHKGDNRIYVPNWLTGGLLAVDLNTFTVIRSYAFSPYGGMGYSENDIYRVAAGGPGRIVWEEEDQWIDINIFDTVAGTNIAQAFVREGGGAFGLDHRYYYHGDNNISDASIHKYDVTGDRFTEMASVRIASGSYYGSRTVLVSEDGSRVFWNGGIFDADLGVQWTVGEEIYACSLNGRYAFGQSKVFDVEQHNVITNLATATPVKTYNTLTEKLVFKNNNTIGFYKLNSKQDGSPANASIVYAPQTLQWNAVPTATTYQVYLGQSQPQVAGATTNSPAFLGQSVSTVIALSSNLPAGTYYWRVDAVTPYGIIPGPVNSFTVSPVIPDQQSVDAATFVNRPVTLTIHLASQSSAEPWQATADAPWMTLTPTNGTSPGAITITLSAAVGGPIVRTGSITISGTNGRLFSIPVKLTVEALNLTILKSDPLSAKVYGISENTGSTPARAYLLEINTATETIERVVNVGSSVTDLAIHNGDNRIYVPNWLSGSLRAIDKDTFQQVRSYTFAPFGGVGYSQGDIYRVSAGGPGRLVWEEEDQWIDITLFDTAAGTNIARAFVRQGGGGFGSNGHYYYHGDDNDSGAEIHKYDMTGDRFMELAAVRVSSVSYYGSRTVVVSEDGSRVFWNGSVFNADLVEEWTIRDEIFATSANGRYAFSQTAVYDINQKKAVLGMPVNTRVSAFNSTSQKLIVPSGNSIAFYQLSDPLTLPTPVLTLVSATYNTAYLTWTDRSLESTFTLQKRVAGTATWQDIATTVQNVFQYTATGLLPHTTYEFRIKADAIGVSSPWSDILTVTTPGVPPTTPYLYQPFATVGAVSLSWSNPDYETGLVLERSIGTMEGWTVLTNLPADTIGYVDTDVLSRTNYFYRIKARNSDGDSPYSSAVMVTVPAPAPPQIPQGLFARSLSNATILVSWNDVLDETGYRLERRNESPTSWQLLSVLASNTISYLDTNVSEGVQYWYRIVAFNGNGASAYSLEATARAVRIVALMADDFDPDIDPIMWTQITGGIATNGGQGFGSSKVLYFAAGGQRQATTIPVDVSTGGTIEFTLRAGNEAVDGNAMWNNSEQAEGVTFEYSRDGGLSWFTLQTLNTVFPGAASWTRFSLQIPGSAYGPNTLFRWRQLSNSGPAFDTWALDDVSVQGVAPQAPQPVPFIISSPASATSIAIFWVDALGASSYLLERKTGLQPWAYLASMAADETYYTDSNLIPESAYSYRVRALNAGGESANSPVTTSFTWSQLEQWCVENYGTLDMSHDELALRQPDGTSALVRYAFGLNATEPARVVTDTSTSGYPAIWLDKVRHRLCVEFVRRKDSMKPGIAYEVQFSADLVLWSSAGSQVSATSLDPVWERVLYEDVLVASQQPARFCRVRVTFK